MNLGDLTGLVERPFAAVSDLLNTPNSAGRYRPFYLRNLLDAVQGRVGDHRLDVTLSVFRLPITGDALIGHDPHGGIAANDRTADIGDLDACPAGLVLWRIGQLRLRSIGEGGPWPLIRTYREPIYVPWFALELR